VQNIGPDVGSWYKKSIKMTSKISTSKRIIKLVGKAIGDFSLVEDNDRILVALSGGKDSWSLLYSLLALEKRAPIHYEIRAVTIAPDPNTAYMKKMADRLDSDGIPYKFIFCDISSIVSKHLTKGTNPCSFCSRIRRGILYSFASSEGWNKIALGHHLDDFVETLLLNLFYNGSIKGMSPKLAADDGKNMIIRPLVYVREENTARMAEEMGLPVVDCGCIFQRTVDSKRLWVKQLLTNIEKEVPSVKNSILSSMGRVYNRHLLNFVKKTEDGH
jgi:tRNA 2-thiocytidine biosynthesis protein TtcA